MIGSKNKLTFQLTPLLDLLLIVIFAQYMEVQQTSAEAEAEIARRAEEETSAARKAQLLAEAQYQQLKNQRQTLQSQLQEELVNATEEMQQLLNQRKDLAELVARMFNIPQSFIDKALAGSELTPEEQQQLKQTVEELAEKHRNDVIEHLVTHQAMRKRVDVWTLFLTREGNAQLTVGDETKVFRVRARPDVEAARLAKLSLNEQVIAKKKFEAEAADEFANNLIKAYQTLPQPKSIVVLVVSWKEGLNRYYRKPAREGLDTTLRLFQSTNVETQFIPAVLGTKVE